MTPARLSENHNEARIRKPLYFEDATILGGFGRTHALKWHREIPFRNVWDGGNVVAPWKSQVPAKPNLSRRKR